MTRLGCALAVVLALVGQLLLVGVRVRGVHPLLLPPVVCVLGQRYGPGRGVAAGLLGGVLSLALGGGLSGFALLPLAGGAAGGLFPRGDGAPRRWLLCLPVLAGYELLLVLGHLAGSGAPLGALVLGAKEWVLCALAVPVAEGLVALCGLRRRRNRGCPAP